MIRQLNKRRNDHCPEQNTGSITLTKSTLRNTINKATKLCDGYNSRYDQQSHNLHTRWSSSVCKPFSSSWLPSTFCLPQVRRPMTTSCFHSTLPYAQRQTRKVTATPSSGTNQVHKTAVVGFLTLLWPQRHLHST
jgi:hypothetical protein